MLTQCLKHTDDSAKHLGCCQWLFTQLIITVVKLLCGADSLSSFFVKLIVCHSTFCRIPSCYSNWELVVLVVNLKGRERYKVVENIFVVTRLSIILNIEM